ncbi:MAG: MFS transporter [Motiliproteus sp.]|nr:MFS transporter [Motiliproteus sp.]MCW9050807.1 MFS transporter [Motiliproteus sp.]
MKEQHPPRAADLLSSQRFGPFFSTLFLGAINDNLFKNTLILIFVFQSSHQGGDVDKLTNLAAGLFMLPYLLFSGIAGELADRFEKSSLIRILKLSELGLMILAAQALLSQNTELMFILLFLMATQSAFFSPIKFSIIPQHLEPRQWLIGNSLVELGTFSAILLGTLLAGILFKLSEGTLVISALLVVIALAGWSFSRKIPLAPTVNPDLKLTFNPITINANILMQSWKRPKIRFLQLCIAWFWFLGAAYLTQVPHYAEAVLGGDSISVSWLLCCFTLGIGAGSLLCNRLSQDRLGRDMVAIGLLGLLVFGVDLYFATPANPLPNDAGLMQLLSSFKGLRVTADIILIGLFAGCYIVPLYTQILAASGADKRARVIAANNIISAVYMIASATIAALLLGWAEMSLPSFFLILALANLITLAMILHKRSIWLSASLVRILPKRWFR